MDGSAAILILFGIIISGTLIYKQSKYRGDIIQANELSSIFGMTFDLVLGVYVFAVALIYVFAQASLFLFPQASFSTFTVDLNEPTFMIALVYGAGHMLLPRFRQTNDMVKEWKKKKRSKKK